MKLGEKQGIKVLRHGESCHGGTHRWSLPSRGTDGAWTPGEWTPTVPPTMAEEGHHTVPPQGWHLTREPAQWWDTEDGTVAYLAEWNGSAVQCDDKIAVSRCRLLRELTHEELATFGVYLSGHHTEIDRASPATDMTYRGCETRTWVGGDAVVDIARIGCGVLCISGRAVVRDLFAFAQSALRILDTEPKNVRSHVRTYFGTCVYLIGPQAELAPQEPPSPEDQNSPDKNRPTTGTRRRPKPSSKRGRSPA